MKCKICGMEFELKKENKYLCGNLFSVEEAMSGKCHKLKEAFDCPYCGCQNIVNDRENEFPVTYCNV